MFASLVKNCADADIPIAGDLMDEDAILKWMTSEETLDIPDQIERVNQKMLEKLLNTSPFVAVLFGERRRLWRSQDFFPFFFGGFVNISRRGKGIVEKASA